MLQIFSLVTAPLHNRNIEVFLSNGGWELRSIMGPQLVEENESQLRKVMAHLAIVYPEADIKQALGSRSTWPVLRGRR